MSLFSFLRSCSCELKTEIRLGQCRAVLRRSMYLAQKCKYNWENGKKKLKNISLVSPPTPIESWRSGLFPPDKPDFILVSFTILKHIHLASE